MAVSGMGTAAEPVGIDLVRIEHTGGRNWRETSDVTLRIEQRFEDWDGGRWLSGSVNLGIPNECVPISIAS